MTDPNKASLLQLAQEKDPRRGFACVYCDDEFRDALCALVVFDSEIWAVHSRAGEMAQFRLQFWADKITQYPDFTEFDGVSNALVTLLQGGIITKQDLLLYIDCHFTYISEPEAGREHIWRQYFTLSAKLCGHGASLAPQCAAIIINAIRGDFAENRKAIAALNAQIPRPERGKYINDLLFLRLARDGAWFNDININRTLGLRAQCALFSGRLFNRI